MEIGVKTTLNLNFHSKLKRTKLFWSNKNPRRGDSLYHFVTHNDNERIEFLVIYLQEYDRQTFQKSYIPKDKIILRLLPSI